MQQVGILETLSRIWKKIKEFLDNDEISLNCRVQLQALVFSYRRIQEVKSEATSYQNA